MVLQEVKNVKSAEEMPGSYGFPFVGEIAELFSAEELFYWQHFQRYGTVFKTGGLGRKYAFLIGPDANRFVLMEQAENLSSGMGWWFLKSLFGEGLLLQDGAAHKAARRLIYPAFHGRTIAAYFNTIQNIVFDFLKNWDKRGTVALAADFRKLTLIVASRLFLGTQTNEEVAQTCEWFTQLIAAKLALLRLNIPFTLYGRALTARRHLNNYLHNTIVSRRNQNKLNPESDVLGLLMTAVDEDGNSLSEEEIIEQTLLLLVAGHETTATLLSWVMFELGSRPEWRRRLREELNQVVGNGPLELGHLKHLTDMTNVLKEVERLYPPIYGIPRGVVKEIEYAGYRIPPGWFVIVSPMLTHHLPELYFEPDRFDPDRFAPPREEDKKHPYALLGFGHGAHSCLGFEFAQMEMKIILATLLLDFDWTVTPDIAQIAPVRQPSKIQNHLLAHIKRE